jgi:hypothetical protein
MGGTYEADEPRYEKGDRVWVLGGGALRKPGLVIGHHVDWNLYRIVYTLDLTDQDPRAIEEWRLSFRKKGEPRQAQAPATESHRLDPNRSSSKRSLKT